MAARDPPNLGFEADRAGSGACGRARVPVVVAGGWHLRRQRATRRRARRRGSAMCPADVPYLATCFRLLHTST